MEEISLSLPRILFPRRELNSLKIKFFNFSRLLPLVQSPSRFHSATNGKNDDDDDNNDN